MGFTVDSRSRFLFLERDLGGWGVDARLLRPTDPPTTPTSHCLPLTTLLEYLALFTCPYQLQDASLPSVSRQFELELARPVSLELAYTVICI